jgi:hypothetical protein
MKGSKYRHGYPPRLKFLYAGTFLGFSLCQNRCRLMASINNWDTVVVSSPITRLFDIERKLQAEIARWREKEYLLRCAAFCHILFKLGFFINAESTRMETLTAFAKTRWNVDIRKCVVASYECLLEPYIWE